MTRTELLNKIRQAGVVGAGGAGFPAYKKLDARVQHLIANGAECEPLLYKDRYVMLEEPDNLARGLEVMKEITGATQATLAVKEKNREILSNIIGRQKSFNTLIYKDVYPAGDEYVLVYEITGKRIPPGGLPLQVGCVVNNTETIVNIARAVQGFPVTEKWVTITGAVKEALTTRVPIGISIADCLELAGGVTCGNPVVLTGGVMMGGVAIDLSAPVTKTLGGLIVLPEDHYLVRRKITPRESYTRIGHGQCDQCSLCTELCPRYIMGYPIEPHRVMRNLLMTGKSKERDSLWAQYCCECNVCSLIACPEQLDPKNICVDAKALLRENKLSRTAEELDELFRPVHPVREEREIPIATLYRRLGLLPYDRHAGFRSIPVHPDEVYIPLNSHVGQPANPLASKGDRVQKGQIIAEVKPDQLGCPAHASIAGTVTDIDKAGIRIQSA